MSARPGHLLAWSTKPSLRLPTARPTACTLRLNPTMNLWRLTPSRQPPWWWVFPRLFTKTQWVQFCPNINPAFFGAFPSLQYDSVHHRFEDSNGTSDVQQVGMDEYFAAFENGGGFTWTPSSVVLGSAPTKAQMLRQAPTAVVVGQFTSDGVVNLTMNFSGTMKPNLQEEGVSSCSQFPYLVAPTPTRTTTTPSPTKTMACTFVLRAPLLRRCPRIHSAQERPPTASMPTSPPTWR